MKLGKIEEDVIDIFQEIMDDFPELEFRFRVMNPGHFQVYSKVIDRSMIGPLTITNARKQKRVSSQIKLLNMELALIRKITFNYANKLEPYLEEASDRLGDIGYRCTFDPNQNVRALDKIFNPYFVIQINCYELDRDKIKRFESF